MQPLARRARLFVLLFGWFFVGWCNTLSVVAQSGPRGLARLISCDRAAFNSFDVGKNRLIIPTPMPVYWKNLRAVFREHLHEYVLTDLSHVPGQYQAVTFGNRRDDRVWKKSILYHEYCFPAGARPQMAVIHFQRGTIRYGPNGNGCGRDFTAEDRALVELISPHVVDAWRNASELSQLRNQEGMTGGVADSGEHSAVVDCNAGMITALSPGARGMLRTYFYQDINEGCALPERLSRWMIAQRKLLKSEDAILSTPQPLCVQKGTSSLRIRLMQTTPGIAVILLKDSANATTSSRISIAGCTRRENEVMHWIAEGKRNHEIATILDLSSRTVGKHLEHVFEKLGVENRTAAVHAAFELGTRGACLNS